MQIINSDIRTKLNNLLNKLKEKKDWVLIGLLVVLVVVSAIYAIYTKIQKTSGTYVSTLTNSSDSRVSWSNVDLINVEGEDYPDQLPVYNAEIYTLDDVQEILRKLGVGSANRTGPVDARLYTWTLNNGYATYDLNSGDFVLETDAIRLSDLEEKTLNSSNALSHAQEFGQVYLGLENTLTGTVRESAGNFKVEGSWLLGVYELVLSSNKTSTIAVVFSPDGSLISLNALLVRTIESDRSVQLAEFTELQEYFKYNSYPKEAFWQISAGTNDCTGYDCYLGSSGELQSVDVSEFTLVYYYNPSVSAELLPVFKLTGTGVAIDSYGVTSQVDVTVFANAIDIEKIILNSSQ